MFTMVDGLARLLAPILSVTMDELWRALPGERVPSVHMALFPMGDEVAVHRNPALLERWERLAVVRNLVNLALEQKRQEQLIKANLSARVRHRSLGRRRHAARGVSAFLPTLFGVSQVEVAAGGTTPVGSEPGTPIVHVEKADGIKCERCWRFVPEVSRRSCARGAVLPLRRGAGAGRCSTDERCCTSGASSWLIVLIVVVLDQVTKMLVRSALALHEGVEVDPRLPGPDAGPQHRRRVRDDERRRLRLQDGGDVDGGAGRPRRRRRWYALSVPLTDVLARASASPAWSAGPWAT